MGTNVMLFEGLTIPDHIRRRGVDDFTKAIAGNTAGGNKRISIRGRRFRMVVAGEEIGTSNQDELQVVIVNAAKEISREYYASRYDPKKDATGPDCWSANGITPDAGVEQPVHKNCADCPNNISGSGDNGGRACRFARRIAVALANDPHGGVYQVKLAATSIFGKGTTDGMPFDQYAKHVASHGIGMSQVVTEMSFDNHSDTPKLVFKAVKLLNEDEYDAFEELSKSREASNAIRLTVAQVDGVQKIAPPKPKAEPKVHEDGEEDYVEEPVKRPAKKAKAEVATQSDLNSVLNRFVSRNDETDDE